MKFMIILAKGSRSIEVIAILRMLRHDVRTEGRISAILGPNKQPDEEAVMSARDLPSPEYLRQRLRYDPETGLLYWREYPNFSMRWNSKYPNRVAGLINPRGYWRVCIDYKVYQAHRIIWAMEYGHWPKKEIDHIDGDKTNNRLSNLRLVDRVENSRNLSIASNNTSGVTGVSWHKKCNKWTVRIRYNGYYHYLGLFSSFDEAVKVRKNAEARLGFHKNHGRPKRNSKLTSKAPHDRKSHGS